MEAHGANGEAHCYKTEPHDANTEA